MSHEYYAYDEPIGLWGHRSSEYLAKMVMAEFARHETAQIDAGFIESMGDSSNELTPMIDENRISSLVESRDAYYGYGLITPQLDRSDELGGVWYQIKRDGTEPSIANVQNFSFPRPATLTSLEGAQEVEQLAFQFDKPGLESIVRMLGKMSRRLQASRPSSMHESDNPSYGWLRTVASAPVEKDVLYAIKAGNLERLSLLFPSMKPSAAEQAPEAQDAQVAETRHIVEWTAFINEAETLIHQQASPENTVSHVNLWHEVDNRTYYIKLVSMRGKLFGAQILCDDNGVWQSQKFDIGIDDNEDETDTNIIHQMWDQAAILGSLRQGEVIDNGTYEGYRSLAEKSLKVAFEASMRLVDLRQIDEDKKRPAA